MLHPMEVILDPPELQLRYFSKVFIGLLFLKTVIPLSNHVIGANVLAIFLDNMSFQ